MFGHGKICNQAFFFYKIQKKKEIKLYSIKSC